MAERKLLSLEVTPYLSRLLAQGAVSWSAGRLVTASAVCFAIPSYLVYPRFNSFLVSRFWWERRAALCLLCGPFTCAASAFQNLKRHCRKRWT